jgi:hypothetical protein
VPQIPPIAVNHRRFISFRRSARGGAATPGRAKRHFDGSWGSAYRSETGSAPHRPSVYEPWGVPNQSRGIGEYLTNAGRIVCRLVKFPMEIWVASTDDPRRVWQPGEEPAASAARPRDDAGGSRRAQRRSRHRGQPHRERQARPPSLNGAEVGRSRWPYRKRSAPLSIRPASRRLSAVGDRPFSRRAYFVLNTCRSGATGLTGAIFILAHPLPLVSARRFAGAGKGDGKEVLSAGRLLSAQNACAQGKCLCSDILEKTR